MYRIFITFFLSLFVILHGRAWWSTISCWCACKSYWKMHFLHFRRCCRPRSYL